VHFLQLSQGIYSQHGILRFLIPILNFVKKLFCFADNSTNIENFEVKRAQTSSKTGKKRLYKHILEMTFANINGRRTTLLKSLPRS
jgi:hypothetical protein